MGSWLAAPKGLVGRFYWCSVLVVRLLTGPQRGGLTPLLPERVARVANLSIVWSIMYGQPGTVGMHASPKFASRHVLRMHDATGT